MLLPNKLEDKSSSSDNSSTPNSLGSYLDIEGGTVKQGAVRQQTTPYLGCCTAGFDSAGIRRGSGLGDVSRGGGEATLRCRGDWGDAESGALVGLGEACAGDGCAGAGDAALGLVRGLDGCNERGCAIGEVCVGGGEETAAAGAALEGMGDDRGL